MFKRTASVIMLMLLISCLSVALVNVQLVKATGTIYIRSDGSVDPPGTPIQQNGNTYTFTSDIYDPIVVEKNDVIIDGAGHTLQGSMSTPGIDLSGRADVTVKNILITRFDYGIYLESSGHITISGTTLTNNNNGLWLSSSSYNDVLGNTMNTNVFEGIYVYFSSNNHINANLINANTFDGIYLFSSSDNTISENNIQGNAYGISPYYSTNNRIFHNSFINNQVSINPNEPADIWDDGYPSGGNYWSDYVGTDLYSGPYQNETGSDGIGDTPPYVIDASNRDNYPLMLPWATADIAVNSVTPAKTVVGRGYAIFINVIIQNQGDYDTMFTFTLYANTTVINQAQITLTSKTSTPITFTWDTAGFAYGNCTISAYARPLSGETDTADNNCTDGTVQVCTRGDINGDAVVDSTDLGILGAAWGAFTGDANYNPNADIDNNEVIDSTDLGIMGAHWGETA